MPAQRNLELPHHKIDGHVLLATLMVISILFLLGMTSLYLAGQDVPGVAAMKEEAAAQQLADAAAELVVGWFHDPSLAPVSVAGLLAKREGDAASGPSFFDATRRSQFIGTVDHPDVLLDAAGGFDNNVLNGSPSGFSGSLQDAGRLVKVKLYGPMRPGLLGTLEVTAEAAGPKPMARTIQVQLGGLAVPAVRAAVQVGKGLGTFQPGGESPVRAHWGDQRITGDLIVKKTENVVAKTALASVTGLPYDPEEQSQDRWSDYWIGGELMVTAPSSGQDVRPIAPQNVHLHQLPSPGVRLDKWEYGEIKKIALRHGTYYRLDRQGQLHVQGASEGDQGLIPSEVLVSRATGDQRGLIFIDTLDGEPPRIDNLGTLVIETDYLETLLVVQGHVVLKPRGTGRLIQVLSPAPEGANGLGSRIPVQLSGIHLQGLLWAAGSIVLEGSVKVFGAVMTGESIIAKTTGLSIEVWYNADLAKGLFRGLPVVYRAPGTWRIL